MLSLKIVSPTDTIFEGDVDFFVCPGSEGELGILPGHAPIVCTLKEGKITIRQKGAKREFNIRGGFVEVSKNRATVLSEG